MSEQLPNSAHLDAWRKAAARSAPGGDVARLNWLTPEGIPVRCWCWPGNTNDQAILPEVRDGLRGWRLGRVITVVDRGFSSAENLAYLRRGGGHYIAGERMRAGIAHVEAALARQGRYRGVRDNLRVKEIALEETPGASALLAVEALALQLRAA